MYVGGIAYVSVIPNNFSNHLCNILQGIFWKCTEITQCSVLLRKSRNDTELKKAKIVTLKTCVEIWHIV